MKQYVIVWPEPNPSSGFDTLEDAVRHAVERWASARIKDRQSYDPIDVEAVLVTASGTALNLNGHACWLGETGLVLYEEGDMATGDNDEIAVVLERRWRLFKPGSRPYGMLQRLRSAGVNRISTPLFIEWMRSNDAEEVAELERYLLADIGEGEGLS